MVAITVILVFFGLVTLYSASSVMAQRGDLPHYYYMLRQGVGAVIGLVAMFICSRISTDRWQQLGGPMMVISTFLLVLLILPFTTEIAPTINGARRWLRLGFTVQPSDIAKLAVVVWTASLAVRKLNHFRSLRMGLAPFLVGWGCIVLPIVLEPDLSTAMLIAAVGLLILFTAGSRIAHFLFLGLISLPFVLPILTAGYRQSRWSSLLLDPGITPEGSSFQTYQSLLAIGSGGVTGVGFGRGRQKFGFLPEAHNDFIFGMIGEEWGFVGVIAVILAFLALIVIGFRIARQARNLFGELLAVGLTSMIGLQAFLHIGVGLGLFPTTGLPLPFISFGRTNLVAVLAAVGILLAVAGESRGGRRENAMRGAS